jgi:hypothetical protein
MQCKATLEASGAENLQLQWISPQSWKLSCQHALNDSEHCHMMKNMCHGSTFQLPRQEQRQGHLHCQHSEWPERDTNVLQSTGMCCWVAKAPMTLAAGNQKLHKMP